MFDSTDSTNNHDTRAVQSALQTASDEVHAIEGPTLKSLTGLHSVGCRLAMFVGSLVWLKLTRNALEETMITICTVSTLHR
eukprot:1192815-Rhodomonas_salina.1